ncbi:hypothetical protein VC845_000553 [Salmonella enterica]|nr:hypothetical protein [Salmonella enterica]
MSITSERERVVAPPIQPCDDDNTQDTTVFRSVPQHWTLTPQQRAFIDAFADEVSQKQYSSFYWRYCFINAVLLHRSNRVLSASQY